MASSRFLVKKTSGIERIQQLANKNVISTKGSNNLVVLRKVNEENGLHMQISESADHAEGFAAVGVGRVDAFAMDDILLYGLIANTSQPGDYAVIGKPMTIEPYAIMLPKGDTAFKALIDKEMRRIILSGEINGLYRKWFETPIPPKNINLKLPMSHMLKDSFKFPSDKVGDAL